MTLGNKCAKNLCKRIVLLQLIIENVVTCFFLEHSVDDVAGDIGATWRTAQSLLHNNHKVVYSDAKCASLVSTFCYFFVDKVDRIRNNIAVALQSTVRRVFADKPYLGLKLSSFQMVADEEVRHLLSAMPSKSSPLDVLPRSLLKLCSDVFAPVIADSPTCPCRLESFLPAINERRCCHC